MAAPTYQSTQTTTWATAGSTVVIPKPTSLAVGDLMICRISVEGIYTVSNFGVFTSLGDQATGSGEYITYIGSKIADSSDVAASDFTITISNGGVNKMGSITRISNPDTLASNYKYVEGSATNTLSPSFAGLTPTNHADENLILQFWTGDNGASGAPTISSYAVATSNPSWTEAYELSSTTTVDVTASMAYAVRPQTTATGNFSASWSDGTTDSSGQMIAITIPWTATVTESITLTEVFKGNLTSNTVETTTLTEVVDAEKPNGWTNQTKNTGAWTNQNKS